MKLYKDYIEQLINCEEENTFWSLVKKLKKNWSKPFVKYFEKYLCDDLKNYTCRFITNKYAAFEDPTTTCTNNISESFNKIIKDWNSFAELPLDTFVLTLYKMQMYYLYEFQKGWIGMGNYTLKDDFELKRIGDFPFIYPQIKSLEEIVKEIKNVNLPPPPKLKARRTYRTTQKLIANECIEKNCVGLCAQTDSFNIVSLLGKSVNAVKLFPETSCSCRSTGKCFHIIAAERSIGAHIEDTHEYKLSELLKRKKRKEGKSGRKKPRPHDYDYGVIPAPDSYFAENECTNLQ